MRFDVDNKDLFTRNEATHWGNPLVLQRAYKYMHAAPEQQFGSFNLILLDGSIEELKKSSEVYTLFGGKTCKYLCRGHIWRTQGVKPEMEAFLSHVSGVLPTRKWISSRKTGDMSFKVLNLVAAISEGCLLYKPSNSASPAVVSYLPLLNGQYAQSAITPFILEYTITPYILETL